MFFIFSFLIILERRLFNEKRIFLADLKGLGSLQRIYSIAFAITIFSLAGIPPFPGFFGKLALLYSLILNGSYLTCIFILISTLFIIYYYVKIVLLIFSGSLEDIPVPNIGESIFTNRTLIIVVFSLYFNFWFLLYYYKIWFFYFFILNYFFIF